ncbi:hypothetical protein RUM43_011988 [Polyplax serrata]|uniref:Uncharacterized protein n=1 Tax=Polyplax serrata TaxID=468196 RepID=A0AAN8S4A4_POLSC
MEITSWLFAQQLILVLYINYGYQNNRRNNTHVHLREGVTGVKVIQCSSEKESKQEYQGLTSCLDKETIFAASGTGFLMRAKVHGQNVDVKQEKI